MKRRVMLLNAGLILIAGIAIVCSLVADPTGLDNQTMQRMIGGTTCYTRGTTDAPNCTPHSFTCTSSNWAGTYVINYGHHYCSTTIQGYARCWTTPSARVECLRRTFINAECEYEDDKDYGDKVSLSGDCP